MKISCSVLQPFFNMVKFNLFSDPLRQEEIETFYDICQKHRDFYRGYSKSRHPLKYFTEPELVFQCPTEMSQVYLSYPQYHVKYKQPVALPPTVERTSYMPQLPERCLKGRYGQTTKAYIR